MASKTTFELVAKNLRKLADSMPERVNQELRKVALAVDQVLVLTTPVDTGRARSNWQVTIGAPATGTVNAFPPSAKTDSIGVMGVSGTFAVNAAIAATKNYDGGNIYITNNLPYIRRLNEGWSKQAPAGFVEQAILAGLQAVQSVRILDAPDDGVA